METKKSRRWVVRAMIAFVAILALLTFFSNTIMNATIPRVMTASAMRGNLANSNSATGQLVSDDEVKVKGLENRVVDQVLCTNYDMVSEGDVVITLKPVEDTSALTDLENQLRSARREQAYAARAPRHPADYTSQNQAIRAAEQALADAQSQLNSATTRDETIAAAQAVLAANQAAVTSLTAQVTTASATVESLNIQVEECQALIDMLDNGTYVTTSMDAARPAAGKNEPADSADGTGDPTGGDDGSAGDDTQTTDTSETPAPTPSPSPAPTATPTSAPTATPTPSPVPTTAPVDVPDRATLVNRLHQLQGELASARSRLDGYSAQLAAATAAVESATSAIATARALPSTYAAADAVTDAQAALDAARIALSDQQINDGIAADQAADLANDRAETIEQLERRIEELRESLEVTEIKAPADGYIFNMAAEPDAVLSPDTVIFSIVPEDSAYTVSFAFSATVAQNLYVGQELGSDNYYWINSIVITNIKPDEKNPRESRIVKCAVNSYSTLWPGESITVTTDRSNANYDHVIASSAVSEDNSGTFVYVVDSTSGPLGDKYVVRRVSVSIEARSGALVAITGEGLDGAMIVTRSEEPLNNGDRVRLEDYSSGR